MDDNPAAADHPRTDAIEGLLNWLGKRIDQLVPRSPVARRVPPASMTDEQLHEAVYHVGAELLDNVSVRVLMPTYAADAIKNDPRFPHGMPTTVRDQVLLMFTSAHDSFGLSLIGLWRHATAAALGPIRNIAETLTLTKWLLENPSKADRQGRAYRLCLEGIGQLREDARVLRKVSPNSAQTLKMADWMANSADLMERNLQAIAQQEHVTVARKPPNASRRAAMYLSGTEGYMLHALTSAAGVHPGAQRAVLFYRKPGAAILDFDFKGMHAVRAYWIAVSLELHVELCRLVMPVLGWQKWEAAFDALDRKLQPLAAEAKRRMAEPLMQEWQIRVASGEAPDIL